MSADHQTAAYLAYTPKLRNFARQRVRVDLVDDCVGEMWLLAVRHWAQCEDERARFSWLCSILVNVILDGKRKAHARRAEAHISLDDGMPHDAHEPTVRSHESAVSAHIDVMRVVRRLSETQREVIVKRLRGELLDRSNVEKLRLFRARQRMRWYMTRGNAA